jgi:hypothetical protein
MKYAAEKDALDELNNSMSKYGMAANKLKLKEAELAKAFESEGGTYADYIDGLNKAMEAEIKAGTLTEDQIASYVTKHGENQKGASANAVKNTLQSKGLIGDIENFEK